jgi:hypothetical protein
MAELPEEIRQVFEAFGYGCLAAETNIGVVHVCHAADSDIEGLANKPVPYQWQLAKMPTASLIRLELAILDRPSNPYRFESFLNVAEEDQARVLAQLAGQDRLYLAFYGDDFNHRFTKVVNHDRQQWQYLDELVMEAVEHWHQIPPEQRDFDQAKAGPRPSSMKWRRDKGESSGLIGNRLDSWQATLYNHPECFFTGSGDAVSRAAAIGKASRS